MRGKEQRSVAVAHDFCFEETTEFGGGDGVEAARGLIEKQNAGTMEERASEAEALHGAGGKGADLAGERFAEMELIGELGDSLGRGGARELIQLPEEEKILAGGQARVEAVVGACMIAELAAHCARLADSVMTGDTRVAASGHQESGENAKERGFASSVGAEKRQ